MRVIVILNPGADLGHGFKKKDLIIAEGAKWGGLDLVVSETKGDADRLAQDAAAEGYDVIAAAGGDGTVHDVINGMLRDGFPNSSLGVIPLGTGNDFAYAVNAPVDISQAVEQLFQGDKRLIDLGRVEDNRGVVKIMANNFGIGFDANVVIRTSSTTRLHGFPKYFWGVLKTLVLDFRPFKLDMRFDDEAIIEDVLFVAFGVGCRHGGGFMLTPDARYDDEKVDTCTVRPMSRLHALILLNSAVKGTHIHEYQVTMRQSRTIEISCEASLPVHIDGEIFSYPDDDVHQVTVTSVPSALNVIV